MTGFFVVFLLFGLPVSLVAYYGAILTGMYKDPLLHHFSRYGVERRPPVLPRFLLALAAWFIGLAVMARLLTAGWTGVAGAFLPTVFLVLGGAMAGSSLLARRSVVGRESLPQWYYTALSTMTRQERRQVARAWVRLPRLMHWRLNGDQASFRVWVDMVRLTVIYGAQDPTSPWDRWT